MVWLFREVLEGLDAALGRWSNISGCLFDFLGLASPQIIKHSARDKYQYRYTYEADRDDKACIAIVFVTASDSVLELFLDPCLNLGVGLLAADGVVQDEAEGRNAISIRRTPRPNELVGVRELIYFSLVVLKNSDIINGLRRLETNAINAISSLIVRDCSFSERIRGKSMNLATVVHLANRGQPNLIIYIIFVSQAECQTVKFALCTIALLIAVDPHF